jgi:hypothetical protein
VPDLSVSLHLKQPAKPHPTAIRPLDAVAYIAVPGDGAESTSATTASHRRQFAMIRGYARTHGFRVRKTRTEHLMTSKLGDRRRFARIMAEAWRKKLRWLLLVAADTLPQDEASRRALLGFASRRRVKIIDVESNRVLEPVAKRKAAASEDDDLRQLRRRFRRWLRDLRRREATRPTLQDKTAVAQIIKLRRLLPRSQWFRCGHRGAQRRSFEEIASRVNELGFRRARGLPWSASAVREVIATQRPHWLHE